MSSKGSQPETSDYGVNKSGLGEYAQTQQGKSYGDLINVLKNNQTYTRFNRGGTVFAKNGAGEEMDISGLVGDYNSWLQAQAASNKQRNSYLSDAADLQGRDSTILTGPASTRSLLG